MDKKRAKEIFSKFIRGAEDTAGLLDEDKKIRDIVISIILVLALVFTYLGLRRVDLSPYGAEENSVSDVQNEETPTQAEDEEYNLTGIKRYLVAVAKDEEQLSLVFIVEARLENKVTTCYSLDLGTSGTGGYADIFKTGGRTELMNKISENLKISFDKYIYLTDANFVKCIKTLGEITLSIPDNISYSNEEVNIRLAKGESVIEENTLLGYMKYGSNGAADNILSSQIFATILGTYLTAENAENGEKLFKKVIDYMDTDITAMDYSDKAESLAMICKSSMIYVGGGNPTAEIFNIEAPTEAPEDNNG